MSKGELTCWLSADGLNSRPRSLQNDAYMGVVEKLIEMFTFFSFSLQHNLKNVKILSSLMTALAFLTFSFVRKRSFPYIQWVKSQVLFRFF